ncbi:MAG: hypothetical protein AAGH60_09880 [Pseudomonadota bacterium]
MKKRLPISLMLMNTFAGILAILMAVTAVLLVILVAMNHMRGDLGANGQLLTFAVLFGVGSAGFFALKRWAQRVKTPPVDT